MGLRVLGLVLAATCALALVTAAPVDALRPTWLQAWEDAHPDPRDAGSPALAGFRAVRQQHLAENLGLALLGGLLAGLALASSRRGGVRARLLAACAVAALPALVLTGQRGWAACLDERRATLGDDALATFVGPLADELRDWRTRIPADHALLVLGTHDFLLSRVGWALHPRPVYPLVLPAPAGWDLGQLAEAAAALDTGADAPGRWLVDLAALERREPALVAVPAPPAGTPPGSADVPAPSPAPASDAEPDR